MSGADGSQADVSRPRAVVIANPSKQGIAALRTAVEHAEARQGYAPSVWLDTTEADPGHGQAREAIALGADLVIAAGGDGTVRSVAAGLRGSGVPMGIVPLGTGNLFARNLNLPVNDTGDAVVIAFAGVERRVDALVAEVTRADGDVESHVSLVMAGIGIDATMIANTNPELKKRVGWLAYVDAGLRVLPASEPFRVGYRIDGGRHHHPKASSILVANLGVLPGNIEFVPDASIDDGLLDVVVLQPRNLWGWLFVWRTITWENQVRKTALGRQFLDLTGGKRRREVVYGSGKRVTVAIEGDAQEFEIDGDELGSVVAGDFRVDPGALVMRVAE
ncbi:diacylglycerol/lipid kinase family protein [Agromyces protaetiae]|uniref:diacylglycerol/lipid kinase family protein n=1 Tax=Agromyces protaetiae TaxID=2509455 RepID=UPI0013ED197F|nr:diacylglycerol kinase family protein [Agromyces protaetiae]